MTNPFIDFDEVKRHADALMESLKPLQAAADEEILSSREAARNFFKAYAVYAELVSKFADALRVSNVLLLDAPTDNAPRGEITLCGAFVPKQIHFYSGLPEFAQQQGLFMFYDDEGLEEALNEPDDLYRKITVFAYLDNVKCIQLIDSNKWDAFMQKWGVEQDRLVPWSTFDTEPRGDV